MYRSKKNDDPNQVFTEQGLLYEGDANHTYNLSQLPMLQSFTPKSVSSFRFLDSSWNHQKNPDCRPSMDGLSHGVYGSRAKRIIFEDSNNTKESQLKLFGNDGGLSIRDNQTDSKTQVHAIDNNMITINDQVKVALKRKVIDQQETENRDLDLNLSLQIKTGDIGINEVNENDLTLSLFLSISSNTSSNIRSSKHAKIMDGSSSSRSSTTLDLTL